MSFIKKIKKCNYQCFILSYLSASIETTRIGIRAQHILWIVFFISLFALFGLAFGHIKIDKTDKKDKENDK